MLPMSRNTKRGQSPFRRDWLWHFSPKRALTPFCCLILLIGQAMADDYTDARAELISAYQTRDFPAMVIAAEKALDVRPGYPGALFNLAYAKALNGDNQDALDILSYLVGQGVDYGVADVEELAALQELPGWPDYAAAVENINEPVGEASIAFQFGAGDFVPEGVVALGNSVIIGSVHTGFIERLGDEPATLTDAGSGGHWSVFGMRLGPDGGLWYASAAVPQFSAVTEISRGLTGLFRLDLGSGETTVRAVLPKTGEDQVLGDLIFADDDTIYTTESLAGALYRYSISDNEFTQVVAPGQLRSMQGLVLDSSGDYLYVADYVGGLFRVALDDYSVERVKAPEDVNLFGIDGLYRYGDRLIAIQNGVQPNRVAAFTLGADGVSVTEARVLARSLPEFDEPTLGTIVGDEFLFVANSHWNRFDRDGHLSPDLNGPIILRIKL